MKVVTLFTMIGLILLGSIGICFAQSTTYGPVEVKATIPAMFEIGEVMIRWAGIDPTTGDGYDPFSTDTNKAGDITNDVLDFGTLEYSKDYGIYKASKYFTVRIAPQTSGTPYKITQTCTVSDNLKKHLKLTPGYQSEDKWKWKGEGETIVEKQQGALISGETVEAASLAEGTHTIFTSTIGRSRMIRAYYGLATGEEGEPTGSEPITVDTKAGPATGSITFTLAAN